MANEKNKINALATGDKDPTVELEALTTPQDRRADGELESDANTHDALRGANLTLQSVSDSRLQYDIEQLRAKWLGLEAEIKAREVQTGALNRELNGLQEKVVSKERLIRKRDAKINLLKSEIRQRDEQYRTLSSQFGDMQQTLVEVAPLPVTDTTTNDIENHDHASNELLQKLTRSETYADSMRQQLQDMITAASELESERNHLSQSLQTTKIKNHDLARLLDSKNLAAEELTGKMSSLETQHAEEMRVLRFELGEAQDTVVNTESLNAQLASDLIDTSNFKEELERMLCNAGEHAKSEIGTLKRQLHKLSRTVDSQEQKLSTKSAAISVLLTELASKPEQIDSCSEIENVIHDMDNCMSERFDVNANKGFAARDEDAGRPALQRITRVLTGNIDGQVLRFPLFKDRLTIGRTEDNDIQLNAAFISRRHAVIETESDTTRVIDWGSKNGVYVNGDRVKEHFLSNGDIVTIGTVRFRYEERKKRDS